MSDTARFLIVEKFNGNEWYMCDPKHYSEHKADHWILNRQNAWEVEQSTGKMVIDMLYAMTDDYSNPQYELQQVIE